jgi:hypothetical protein
MLNDSASKRIRAKCRTRPVQHFAFLGQPEEERKGDQWSALGRDILAVSPGPHCFLGMLKPPSGVKAPAGDRDLQFFDLSNTLGSIFGMSLKEWSPGP